MKYESTILKRLIDTYGVVGNPRYISEIIKEFIVRGKERFPELFTYQADWLAHIDEFGLNPTYTVSYTGQSIYAPNTLEKPVKSAILKGNTLVNLVNDVTSNEVGNYNDSPCKIKVIRNLQNETLTIIFNVISLEIPDGADGILRIGGGWSGAIRHKPTVGINKVLYNCTQQSNNWLGVFSNSSSYEAGQRISISEVIVLEGDHTQEDIPYFEGMQSVKMPVLRTSNEDGTKTNILTVNEPVELRGIGDVKDTVDLTTGELTQRIGEIVLDGSENWVGNANFPQTDTHLLMQITLDDTVKNSNGNNMVCDKMQATNYAGFNNKEFDFVCVGKSGSISNLFVKLSKDKLVSFDKNGFNNYFSQNPITVQYELATPTIKTVDLTILDQNGQNVKQLMSFNGGTHFTTSSQDGSLLPTLTVDVVTDLEEILMVCSLEGNTM